LVIESAGESVVKKIWVLLVCLLGSTNSYAGGGIDLALSGEAASLNILLNPRGGLGGNGTTELTFGFITNEVGDNIFNATLLARGVRTSHEGQYNLGAGIRIVGGEFDRDSNDEDVDIDVDETVSALSLGFEASILIAPSNFNPVDLILEAFFAPSISSFADAEEFSEIGARFQVDVVPQARAYVGYRRMAFDTDDYSNLVVDKSVHVGIGIRF